MTFGFPAVNMMEEVTPEMVRFCATVIEALYPKDPETGTEISVSAKELQDTAQFLDGHVREARRTRLVRAGVEAYFQAAHGDVPKKVHPHVYVGMEAALAAMAWEDNADGF